MKEITLEATLDNLDKVNAFIEEQLDEAGCPMKISMQICVAVEELFVNVASYAYGDGTGDITVGFSCEAGTVSVSFIDSVTPPRERIPTPVFRLPKERSAALASSWSRRAWMYWITNIRITRISLL